MSVDEFEINGLASDRSWDWENGYYWFSHPSRIMKFLAHYELYSLIVGIPGSVLNLACLRVPRSSAGPHSAERLKRRNLAKLWGLILSENSQPTAWFFLPT